MKCYYCKGKMVEHTSLFASYIKCLDCFCFANNNHITQMSICDNGNYYIPFKSKYFGGFVFGYLDYDKKIMVDIAYNKLPKKYFLGNLGTIHTMPYRKLENDTDIGELLNTICKVIKIYHRT